MLASIFSMMETKLLIEGGGPIWSSDGAYPRPERKCENEGRKTQSQARIIALGVFLPLPSLLNGELSN